jgi:hypothetical protein
MSNYKIIPVKFKDKWLEAKVSEVDYEYLSQFKWWYNPHTDMVWRKRLAWEPKHYPASITMAANILNFPRSRRVVRVNDDRLDLRRENLRLLNGSEFSAWNHKRRVIKMHQAGSIIPHPMDIDPKL